MPPLPNVPQVCKLEYGGTYHDAEWFNIFYVHYTGGAPTSTDLGTWLNFIESKLAANFCTVMSVDNQVTSLKATDLTTDTGAVAVASFSHFGTRTGDFMPSSVAVVGSLAINRRYRGGHPRKYLPWGTAGTMASGSTKDWDSTFVSDCLTVFQDTLGFHIGFTSGATTWDENVNVSYRTAGAVRPAAVIDVVVGSEIRTRICTQRRRLGKAGG